MARELRVSIVAYRPSAPGFDLERNLEEMAAQIRLAHIEGAELVVVPETCAWQGCRSWPEQAEPVGGQTSTFLGRLAAELGIGLAVGMPLREGGKRYNSLVLFNGSGEIASVYHKAYPTIWEMECGILPGPGAVVEDTPYGRLGFALCYDLNFAELRLAYRDAAPELILFASAFRGGLQTRWWAFETRSYLVSAVIDAQSVMVNPLGRVIAATDIWSRHVSRTLNLDYAVLHYDYINREFEAARRRFGGELEFEWAEPEGVMLASARDGSSIRDIIRDLGWETAESYLQRARRARQDVLNGNPQKPGEPPW